MRKNKSALTLVEVSIGVVLSVLILAVVISLFRAGLRGSTKGMAHQANMETALILMSQIEIDLFKGIELSDNVTDVGASWKMNYVKSNGKLCEAIVSYNSDKTRVTRTVVEAGSNDGSGFQSILEKNVFAKDFLVSKFNFTKYENGSKQGMFVELTIESKNAKVNKNQEPFTLKRFIVIRNNN